MNILQFNVRLTKGGAAGVVLDPHQRALQQGLASHFVYGCGRSDKEGVNHQNYPQVIKHTPWMTAMANIALSRLFNRGLSSSSNEPYCTIIRTPGPVVLHFHVPHSYWLNLKSVVHFCGKVESHRPDIILVWMLYDYWSVTGRYALTGGCGGWKTGCRKHPTLNSYPPVKTDRAYQLVAGKRQPFREMLALGYQFISPSQHMADVFNSLYDPGRCRIINNGINMTTEAILADLPPVRETQDKPKIAVMAYDLRYDGKTNQQLVREMMALDDEIELHTFGKFSPLTTGNMVNYGFEADKRKLMSMLNQVDVLIFSPRVNNYPLILCEALSVDVPVIAIHSDAAQEVPQRSGDKTVSEEDVLQLVQLSRSETAQATFGATLAESS